MDILAAFVERRPSMPRRPAVLLALVAAGSFVARPAAVAPASDQVHFTVADAAGTPIRGLTAADFFIQLDGAPQEILSAGPAADPLSVVLLTDRLGLNSDYRAQDLQKALERFVSTIREDRPESRFALTTFDGIVTQVTRFDMGRSMLDRALGRLSVVASEAPFVDALADACTTARGAPTARRAILVVFAAYRPDRGNPRPDLAGSLCRQSGASLWALEARAPDGRNYPNPAREMVVDEVARASGGMHELVTTAAQLEGLAGIMATLLSAQYQVTFGPGGGTADSRLTVGVKRTDVFVLAPSWTAK
jgi:hypothetical protein